MSHENLAGRGCRLGVSEAVEFLGRGVRREAVGPLVGEAVLVVALGDPEAAAELTMLARDLPCVVVGVADTPGDGPAPDLDVLLTAGTDAPAPWVACGDDLQTTVDSLVGAVARSPMAAVTLAQVLRLGAHLDVVGALVTESLAYAMLQAGPEFRRWLAQRPPAKSSGDDADPVLVERRGAELTVTLNRPVCRNALNTRMRDALVAALEVAIADATVSVIHLRGAGPAFCAGGDRVEFGTTPDPVTGHLVRATRSPAALLARGAERAVAHVHGACVGAGAELAAFAGRVVAAPDTWFSLPEVGMGLIPGAGGTASIPRRIGRSRTAFLALSGERLSALAAKRWGLVDEITDGRR